MEDQAILKELEQAYHKGEYGRVIFYANELLHDQSKTHLRPTLLFWKGTAHLVSGPAWRGEALTCYREALEASGNNKPIKAQIVAGLARISSDAGDCDAFMPLIKDYERLSRAGGRSVRVWGIHIWQNYGTALMGAFRYAEAATAFTKAMNLARTFDIKRLEGRCAHDLSWAEVLQGHVPEARAAMERARDLFPDDEWGHKKLNVEAEFMLISGDPDGALQPIQAALAHPRADDTTRADIYYTWAKALLALGNTGEAREKALKSLDFAVKAVHYPVIHKANRFLHEHRGQGLHW